MAKKIVAPVNPSLNEIRVYDFDFSDDLTSGAAVVSATAEHIPPTGGSVSLPAVGDIVGDHVPVTIGPLDIIGSHKLTVLATLSDGEIREIQMKIKAVIL